MYARYFEILDNGYIEVGFSSDIIRGLEREDGTKNPYFNLTKSVGYAWLLLNFAKNYFNKIDYYDEVMFQLSVINIKGFILHGFGKTNQQSKWPEPYSFDYVDEPPQCNHERFKIREKFIVSEISDKSVKQLVKNLAEKLSRAFGESTIKCFDKDGNFNIEGM